ncbi:MAG: cytoplasmic protein [Acidimicrobiaceae bacterium]|jgi:predicted GH43/DUF377 family glycosyl hydrolase|nr:MAG: cytoplasmic protein [Acidimicrobiaceae bacterium]
MANNIDPRELFRRYDGNPILCATDFPSMVNAAFNPGATTFEGQTLLLVRVEMRSGLSHLAVATSPDGRTNWTLDPHRGMSPEVGSFSEHWGIEDPRITRVGDEYMIVYTGFSDAGPLVCLATTRDFHTFDRRGVIMSPDDKDAALFPVTFDKRWALIHRPAPAMTSMGNHIWLSWSPDLRHWGDAAVLIPARRGGWWDANKVGIGPPPLLTDEGWLVCYHGVKVTASGSIYRLGLALLDVDHPDRCLVRGDEWVMGPQTTYERSGDVPDVVFPCGWILRDDGDTVDMYYGAADSTVCLATASLRQLLDHVQTHPCSEPTSLDRRRRS